MLDPAPPPEGGRGSAVAVRHAGNAQGDGRTGGRAGAGGRILFGGHGRTDRPRGGPGRAELLLSPDENSAGGRGFGDRGGDRAWTGRTDGPGGGGGRAGV